MTPAPSARQPSTGVLLWLALAFVLALACLGAGAATWAWQASRAGAPPREGPAILIGEEHVRVAVEEEIEGAVPEPEVVEPEAVEVVEAPAPAEASPAREPEAAEGRPVRAPRPRTARAEPAPPPATSVGAPSPSPAPTGPPPGSGPPAGVQEAVAHMSRSDWRGCIRAARAAPRSPEILGARMNCALRANDTSELRATCAEMRAHYPSHPQTSSCDSLLRAYGGGP